MDRKLLLAMIEKFDGGPVGVENLAHAIGEETDTIEDVLRALPHPAGLPAAHAARPGGDARRLPPFRHCRAVGRARLARAGRARLSGPVRYGLQSAGAANPRATFPLAGAGVLRRHRFRRGRLLCQLPALLRARAHRVAAQPRRGAPEPGARCGTAIRRAARRDRIPARRAPRRPAASQLRPAAQSERAEQVPRRLPGGGRPATSKSSTSRSRSGGSRTGTR